MRSQFDVQLGQTVNRLVSRDASRLRINGDSADCDRQSLFNFAEAEHAQIRIFNYADGTLLCTQDGVRARRSRKPLRAGLFTTMPAVSGRYDDAGYRVVVRSQIKARPFPDEITLVYAQRLSDVDQTLARVQAFLLLGVLGGAVLALLAGLFVSDRAMSPIKELTSAAREIGRTEDATRRVPHPEAEDEIAELARTLEGMLGALDASRTRTQRMLDRQREFVADASHELRTPLTSVLANLELLTEELRGEQADTAEAALRSTRRMRRLVGDLLLLARDDADRSQPHRTTDLAQVLVDAAAELGPMADHHQLSIDAAPTTVVGARDELHRLILNLLENAVRHTPPGTRVRAATRQGDGEAIVVVEDSGPGIAPDLAAHVFERFVRGGRDGGRGSGLGLAIVRSVARSHGGEVTLEATAPGAGRAPGTRFVIRLPTRTAQAPADDDELGRDSHAAPAAGVAGGEADQTSTTTGRTIGRRRSRS